jgi:hypothetical protein
MFQQLFEIESITLLYLETTLNKMLTLIRNNN